MNLYIEYQHISWYENSLMINTILGKPPKISKHHLPLSCKNKGNQPIPSLGKHMGICL